MKKEIKQYARDFDFEWALGNNRLTMTSSIISDMRNYLTAFDVMFHHTMALCRQQGFDLQLDTKVKRDKKNRVIKEVWTAYGYPSLLGETTPKDRGLYWSFEGKEQIDGILMRLKAITSIYRRTTKYAAATMGGQETMAGTI